MHASMKQTKSLAPEVKKVPKRRLMCWASIWYHSRCSASSGSRDIFLFNCRCSTCMKSEIPYNDTYIVTYPHTHKIRVRFPTIRSPRLRRSACVWINFRWLHFTYIPVSTKALCTYHSGRSHNSLTSYWQTNTQHSTSSRCSMTTHLYSIRPLQSSYVRLDSLHPPQSWYP